MVTGLALVISLTLSTQAPGEAPVAASVVEAPPSTSERPRQTWTRPGARRLNCLWTAATIGAAVSLPTVIPLWIGGTAKGFFLFQLFADIARRTEQARGWKTPAWVTPQSLELMLFAMGVVGAMLNIILTTPQFAMLLVGVMYQLAESTDGLGTGACRDRPLRRVQPTSLGYIPLLLGLAMIPAPFAVAPTVLGLALVLTSMGILPKVPIIPALGFSDRQFAFKRAGLLTTATYPAYWISAMGVGLATMTGVLWLWTRLNLPAPATE
ncbi:MAG: hypothetical protein AB2A00_41300 [Myxococcota bacterium]